MRCTMRLLNYVIPGFIGLPGVEISKALFNDTRRFIPGNNGELIRTIFNIHFCRLVLLSVEL
jgi:hypothetical protein